MNLLIQSPTSETGYWEIVKYCDFDITYEPDSGAPLVNSYTFKECGVTKNKFIDRDELALELAKVITFNPTVGYGAVWIPDPYPHTILKKIES